MEYLGSFGSCLKLVLFGLDMSHADRVLFSAREYAVRFGFAVIPVSLDKRPTCANGYRAGTKSDSGICNMFDRCLKNNPESSGVGIVTGRISNILVLDVDSKKKDIIGFDPLDKLVADYGDEWLDSPSVRTANNGSHFYFKLTEDTLALPCAQGVIPGVDVRCNRGFVVAPPSVVRTGDYVWRGEDAGVDVPRHLPMLDVPDWLFELIKSRNAPGLTDIPDVEEFRIRSVPHPLLRAVLRDSLSKLHNAPEGTRKYQLFRQSYRIGRWVPYGMNSTIALNRMQAIASKWKSVSPMEVDVRLWPAMIVGIKESFNGNGPSLPQWVLDVWELEDKHLRAKNDWISSLTGKNFDGMTLKEILESNIGWGIAFEHRERAAAEFLARYLRQLGYLRRNVRKDGKQRERWFRS